MTTFEKIGESGFVGNLAKGAKNFRRIRTRWKRTTVSVTFSNLEAAAKGSINIRGLESGAVSIAKSEGASSVTVTAGSVLNPRLGSVLTKMGYTSQTVTDSFGRQTTNYVKKINIDE